jgi:hypothetical protein
MHRQRVLWPRVAHRLFAFALVAGCSGQSPLQIKTTNPLEHDERDVLVAGSGCDVGCAAQGGKGGVIIERGGSGVALPAAGYGGTAGFPSVAGAPAVPVRPRVQVCGDGVIDGIESCDGTSLGGMTCATLGYAGGLIACSRLTCTFDVSMCRSQAPNIGIPWMPIDAGFEEDGGVAQQGQ